MASDKPTPKLVFADKAGNIYDHPELDMLVRRGDQFGLPRPDELTPLPSESELFLLPGRSALGFDPESGEVEELEELAVAAFVSPGHTVSGVTAYKARPGAPVLPLFAYAAVGFAAGRFYVCAKRVDQDQRQVFTSVKKDRITKGARMLMSRFPKNRLLGHLSNCALNYCCPAARNLALGRFEAPLPTSQACNARCVGCLSLQDESSGFPSTQNRITFRPTPQEVAEVMAVHSEREPRPILSFGQGCEGEPLTEAPLLAEAARLYRAGGGKGTVNVNTNGSRPEVVEELKAAGFDSMRVSMVSARKPLYEAYTRPQGYGFEQVAETVARAKQSGLWVSLNFLYHPGVSDTEEELEALGSLIEGSRVDYVQLRNLNLDPDVYKGVVTASGAGYGASMGLANFMKRLRKRCPWLKYGYFNPYLVEGKMPGALPTAE
ncbi:radical SAM protein [Fundidesulfovibrio agrisoli]|uniref:radical SAM protein n=1 Tax=Fundidesulfovibrio agrisoli TaxID=2922717 RepID=UPI001FADD19D|nr:radical SAM protein [Fundidesulfovibrio agrisoli]